MTKEQFKLALKVYVIIRDLQKIGVNEKKAIQMARDMILKIEKK